MGLQAKVHAELVAELGAGGPLRVVWGEGCGGNRCSVGRGGKCCGWRGYEMRAYSCLAATDDLC